MNSNFSDDNISKDEIMSNLVSELSQLNRKIESQEISGRFSDENWNYLFGFRPSARTSRSEYTRYVKFMKAVTEVLNEFGIHIGNNGYSYIIDAVMVIIDRNTLDIRLNNDVYPYVAVKYNYRKYSVIEHNIRNAIKAACLDNERNPGTNKMGNFGRRPTNKQFLFYVTEEVCRRMCEDIPVLLS